MLNVIMIAVISLLTIIAAALMVGAATSTKSPTIFQTYRGHERPALS